MSVGVLIVTHDGVGKALLETATAMLGMCPLRIEILAVHRGDDPEALIARARQLIRNLDQERGVLVLTDMYGSTPSNIAAALIDQPGVRAIAGMNLPMLIRIMNYPRLELDQMVEKAVEGGREGVMACKK